MDTNKPKQRALKVEEAVLTYLADLLEQWNGMVRAQTEQALKTGCTAQSSQSNTVSAPPAT